MQRHQERPVVRPVHIVHVRDQGHLLQEAGQRRLVMAGLVGHHLTDEFIDVLEPVLRVLLVGFLQLLPIARGIQHILDQLLQAVIFHLASESPDHGDKRFYFGSAFSHRHNLVRLAQGVKKADPPPVGIVLHPQNGRGSNPSSGHVDDTLYRKIIPAVFNSLQIGKDILDLLSGVKIHAAHHVIGNPLQDEPFLQKPGLGIGAVQYGKIPVLRPVPLLFLHDIRSNELRFLISRLKPAEMDLLSFFLVRPEPLILSGGIVPDHGVCRIQDRLRGTVILLQLYHRRLRKHLLKIQDIADIRPPEFIDRLVVVTHHAEISVFLRQKPDQLKLRGVGILILVHTDITEPLLIAVQHIRIHPEQLHRFHDQIIKIQRIVLFQRILILPVGFRRPSFGKVPHGIQAVFLRRDKLVLCR